MSLTPVPPDPLDGKRRSLPRAARWGLLLVTALMGAALVGSATAGLVAARLASAAVSRASGGIIIRTLRRDLFRAGDNPAQALREATEELQDEGLRFAGIRDGQGTWVATSGPVTGSWEPDPAPFPDGPPVEHIVNGMYRMMVPWHPGPHGKHGPESGAERGRMDGEGGRGHHSFLAVEFEPTAARVLVSRASLMLGLSVAATLSLFLAALYFWRQSRRYEEVEAQLAQDRQLKALGQMSAVLGHELRNPLTSLKGHAQLLLERLPADHPSHRGAETVVREATRLELLTNQVLDFARTGALERSTVDVAELARAAVERAQADPVQVHVEGTLPPWNVDRARLEQVVVNLLNNARQASPGGATVELRLALEAGRLVLEVRDHGDGIRPGVEERMFEPFFTTRVKGTGLGLPLARRIVEGHGGTLVARNHPQGGALLRAELPGTSQT